MKHITDEATGAALGLVVCPLAPAAILGLYMATGFGVGATFFAIVYYVVGLVAAGVLGAPMFFFFRAIHLVKWWTAMASGAVVGLCVAWSIRGFTAPPEADMWAMVPCGALSGLVFWALWRLGSERSRFVQQSLEVDDD